MSGQTWEWSGRRWESGDANNDDQWWEKKEKESSSGWKNETGQYTEYSEQEWASWNEKKSKGKKQWESGTSGSYSGWTGTAADDSSSVSSSTWPAPTPAPVVAQAKAKKKETRDQIMRQGREARAGGRTQPNVEELADGSGGTKNEAQPAPAATSEAPPPPAIEEVLPVAEHRLDRPPKASVEVEGSAVPFIPQPQHVGIETEKLNAYTGSKQHDSFTSGSALTPLFSTSRAEDSLTATVSLPVGCGYRATFTSKPFELSQEFEAKTHAGKECLKALTDAEQLDSNYDPVTGTDDHVCQVEWPARCRDPITMEQLTFTNLLNTDTWPEVVVLIRVEPNPKPDGWMGLGFIIAPSSPDVHLNFALQVEPEENQSVWLEPSRLTQEDIEFFGGNPLAVQEFHNIYKTAAGLDEADSKCVVRLVGSSIDWEQMSYVVEKEELDEEVPPWFKPLWQRVDSLIRLQQLSHFAPVAPVPNPLRLEAVLGGGCGSGHEAFSTLELIGSNVLKLLFSIAMYIDRPFDDAKQLSNRINSAQSRGRLGEMFMESQLDYNILESENWRPRKDGISMDKAASMLEALVGAYVSEIGGDFYSIVKLWKWLCESAGRDEFVQCCKADLTKAVQFLSCAAPVYKGRTPTYEYFSQVDRCGVVELDVKYEDRGLMAYRRPGTSEHPYGVEVGPEEDKTERPVRYDTGRAAWQSPTIMDQDEKGCCRCAVLPNKVTQFLRGQCPAALTTWKPYKGDTPNYDALRELRDGSLQVLYRKEGWFQYQRCPDGGLGFETSLVGKDGLRNPVVYTERGKTLLSPYFNLQSLPNKVTEWLLRWKCLSQLVTPKSNQNEDVNIQEHDDWIEWTTNAGQRRMCRCEHVQCAIIFVAGAKEEELEELLFDGQTWATVNDRAPLPINAVKWLTRRASDKGNSSIYRAYAEQRKKTVWLPPPLQLVSCFPRLQDTDIGQLQTSLSHDFANSMLLAEALTHASVGHGNHHDKSLTPDCQRLACVGSAVAEELVARLLFDAAKFSTAATIPHGCHTSCATYAVGRAEKCDVSYPRPIYKKDDKDASPRIPVCANAKDLRDRWNACCSHVAYATSCVQMQLHKGIQHNSPELSRSIKAFAGTVNKAWKKDANPWPRILANDAPRAIGDAFIACLGAMVLDGGSGYLQAREVLIKHVQWCERIPLPEVDVAEQCGPEDITPTDLLGFVKDARGTVCEIAFAPPAPPLRPDEGEGDVMPTGDGAQQVRNALALTDLYACKINGVLVGARSPRTAPLCAKYGGHFQDVDSDSDVEDPPAETAKAANQGGRMAEGDAVYCEICEMWLNGPTQWEDHRIGKKHKKNCKRQEQGSPGATTAAPTSKSKAQTNKKATDPPPAQQKVVQEPQVARGSQPWPDVRGDQDAQYPPPPYNHHGPGYDFHGRPTWQHAPPPPPPPQHFSGYEHQPPHPYPYGGMPPPPPMMGPGGYAPWPPPQGGMMPPVMPPEYAPGDAQGQRWSPPFQTQ